MQKTIKLLVFAKTLDGGIGTFLLNFFRIKSKFPEKKLIIKTVVIDKPRYFAIRNHRFTFLKKRDYSLVKYSLSLKNLLSYIHEILWFRKQVNEFNHDIVLGIDINCNLIIEITKLFFFKKFRTILTTHIDLQGTLIQKSTPSLHFFLKRAVSFFTIAAMS